MVDSGRVCDHSAKAKPGPSLIRPHFKAKAPNPRHPGLWDPIHQQQGTGTVFQGHEPGTF